MFSVGLYCDRLLLFKAVLLKGRRAITLLPVKSFTLSGSSYLASKTCLNPVAVGLDAQEQKSVLVKGILTFRSLEVKRTLRCCEADGRPV